MKKVFILLVVMLSVIGCSKVATISDEKDVGEVIENKNEFENINIADESEEITTINENIYKLGEGYFYDEKDFSDVEFNLINDGKILNNESQNITIGDKEYELLVKFNIYNGFEGNECYFVTSGDAMISFDGNEVLLASTEEDAEYDQGLRFSVGIIDLDKNDEYKEIAVLMKENFDGILKIYRINENGVEILFNEYCSLVQNDGLKYNKRTNQYVIFDKELAGIYCDEYTPDNAYDGVKLGYYIYRNGSFEYIYKFINGDNIREDNGSLNKNFTNEVFSVGAESSGLCVKDCYIVGGKVNILDISQQNTYKIVFCEDCYVKDYFNGNEIFYKKGTIISDVYDWVNK